MKVFVDNKVYVQNNDLAYLMRGAEGLKIPSSIFDKVYSKVFVVTDSNRYEFVEFSLPEEVEFFKNLDWIVDYNDFDGMSEKEIVNIACQINEERNRIATNFNEMSEKEREKKYYKVGTQIELLEFKMWSVRDVLWHKQKHLDFSFPEGAIVSYLGEKNSIEIPETNVKAPIVEEVPEEPKNDGVLRKVLRRFGINRKR